MEYYEGRNNNFEDQILWSQDIAKAKFENTHFAAALFSISSSGGPLKMDMLMNKQSSRKKVLYFVECSLQTRFMLYRLELIWVVQKVE
jgi:hypothetical protein